MRKVLTLACLLALGQQIAFAQQCGNVPQYTETFVPECTGKELYINWPNYENIQTFYKCNGVGYPVLESCPANQYFCFVYQQCVSCNEFIPAVPCAELKTENKPTCVPTQSGGTTKSTAAPTTKSTAAATTKSTAAATTKSTAAPTTKSTAAATTKPTAATPPTENPGPSTPDIPGPPSPVTNAPNIPMPPTPPPTPPSVSVAPPNIPSAPIG